MTVRELLEYFKKTNVDLDSPLYVETESEYGELINIIEDKRGIYLCSE